MKYEALRAAVAALVVAAGVAVVSAQEAIPTPIPQAGTPFAEPGFVDVWDGGIGPVGSPGMVLQESGMVVEGPMMDPAMACPPPYAHKCFCCEPKSFWPAGEMSFTVTADSLVMTRRRPDRQGIIYDSNTSTQVLRTDDLRSGTSQEVLGAQDLSPGYEFGARIAAAWHPDDWHDLEFVYFGVDTGAVAEAKNGNFVFHPPGNILRTDRVALTHLTDLHSYEVNAWGWRWPWLGLAAGLRLVDLDDSFFVHPGTGGTEGFAYLTENSLVGFQLAGKALLWERGAPLSLDGFMKLGAYYNRIDYDARRISVGSPNSDLGSARDSEDQATLIVELGLTGKLRIFDWLSVRTGYQVTWIEGVALAVDQVPVSNLTLRAGTIDVADSALYHGAFFGLIGEF